MAGTLFVVATPIGNLEDISARALRVLREVALIAAEDTRRTGHLLARYALTTPTTSLHEHNEAAKGDALLQRLLAGESIALVSDAGTPTVSDPGARLIAKAAAARVRVEPIPGPSAAMAALSVSGFPFEQFVFLGFAPSKGPDRAAWFDRLKVSAPCAVFYESPHRITFTLEELKRKIGDVHLVVGREMTKVHEQILRGTVSEIIDQLGNDPVGEFTIVAEIGRLTEHGAAHAPPSAASLYEEFCHMTDSGGLTRRQAISKLSRNYGLSAGVIYDLIESAKGSVG